MVSALVDDPESTNRVVQLIMYGDRLLALTDDGDIFGVEINEYAVMTRLRLIATKYDFLEERL
jgi:hypothetical protein